ncbi:sigma-70 family RNA polymerase sigma factor [Pseudoduganella sp. FT25W]|jgi:RNA polymerase sigma-70 factor (ECF subfamily)|uniref:Sigma-70 family RNA polymerase sigma factor n=1 Tax=Duganella alba TaxID=2666081 RepID=A0A6L5QEC5_9BURK|nr:sigma-70 family RNA polymerase sigma factor [Duganella alba]MRX07471.1 sigma-70 family RNA polymerase sigma factor [Duganella alba]MRX15856.1 sigma-70 family RNA polymerase sigma factor [Duganella alba]
MDCAKIDRRHQTQLPPDFICTRSNKSIGWVSLADLYKSRWRFVLSQALFITQSPHAAEEIAQDVFAFAWRHGDSYESAKSSLATWLSMLCRSRCLDYLRSQRVGYRTLDSDAGLEPVQDEQSAPEARHASNSLRDAVSTALRTLPRHQRQLLVMHYYADLSHAEIAVLTDLPLGTVKTTIRRAKIALESNRMLHAFS